MAPKNPNSDKSNLRKLLESYQLSLREDSNLAQSSVAAFQVFLDSHPDVFHRHHPPGHFTASAWLISQDGLRVLLTHHKKLGRWLQLGGHADGDHDLAQVALTEALEESGLTDLQLIPGIFDLDAHIIPARGNDPDHIHWDVRFVIRAMGSEAFAISEESLALAWRDIGEVAQDPNFDASLRRMAQRWLQPTSSSAERGRQELSLK